MKKILTLLSIIHTLILISSCGVTPGTQNRETSDYARAELSHERKVSQRLTQLTNAHRAKLGLDQLSYDNNLKALAMEHSEYIAKNHKSNTSIRDFAHAGVRQRAEVVRIKYSKTIGENVAWYNGSSSGAADNLFNILLSSKSHRKAIEKNDWKWIGVSAAKGPTGYYYATQLFARPHIKPPVLPQMIFL